MAPRNPRIQSGNWIRVMNTVLDDDRVSGHGADHFALWLAGLVYCSRNMTDGRIPKIKLAGIAGDVPLQRPQKAADSLVGTGAWIDDGAAWIVHRYLDYQTSREEVEGYRAKNKDRMTHTRSRERSANVRANTEQTFAPDSREVRRTEVEVEVPISDNNKRLLLDEPVEKPPPQAPGSRPDQAKHAPHGSSPQETPQPSQQAETPAQSPKPLPTTGAKAWQLAGELARRQAKVTPGIRDLEAWIEKVRTKTMKDQRALLDSVIARNPSAELGALVAAFGVEEQRSRMTPTQRAEVAAHETTGSAALARMDANTAEAVAETEAREERERRFAAVWKRLPERRREELEAEAASAVTAEHAGRPLRPGILAAAVNARLRDLVLAEQTQTLEVVA